MSEKNIGRPKKDGKKKQIIISEDDLEKLRKVMPGLNESDLIRRGVNLAANTYEKEIKIVKISDTKIIGNSNGATLCHFEHYDELTEPGLSIKCEEIIGLSKDRFRVKLFKEKWKSIDNFLDEQSKEISIRFKELNTWELDNSYIFQFYRSFSPNELSDFNMAIKELVDPYVERSELTNIDRFYRNDISDKFDQREVLKKMSFEEIVSKIKSIKKSKLNKEQSRNNLVLKDLKEQLKRENTNIKNIEEELKKLRNLLTEGAFDEDHSYYSTVKESIALYEKSLKVHNGYKNEKETEIEKLTAENNKLIQIRQAEGNNYFQFNKQDISTFEYKTETYGAQIQEHINSMKDEKNKSDDESYLTKLYKYRLNLIENIEKKDYYTDVFTLLDGKLKQLSNEKSREFNSIKPSIKKLLTEIFETLNLWDAEGESEQGNIKYTEVDYEKIMDDLTGKHINRFSFNRLENISGIKDLYLSTQTLEGIKTSLLNLYLKYPHVSYKEKENLEKKFREIDKVSNLYNLTIDKSEILKPLREDLMKRFKDSFSVMSELKNNGFFSVQEKQFERQEKKKRELKEKERKDSIKAIDEKIKKIKRKIKTKYNDLPPIKFTIKSQSYLVFEDDQNII